MGTDLLSDRSPRGRLIVALDFAASDEALSFVDRLGGDVGFYKVGLELFSVGGPEIIRSLRGRGHRVMVDLKLHDIPATVERAAAALASLGADLITVHALGGPAMLEAAVRGARASGGGPAVVAVTLLTSHRGGELPGVYNWSIGIAGIAEMLAAAARSCGLDGVVASAIEAGRLRAQFGPEVLIVTPGVRPGGAAAADQARIATPAEAVRAGSDLLVVGRPITRAPDPVRAAREILAEMAGAEG
jgi:orotidine-5'-phosphate decarboxylase